LTPHIKNIIKFGIYDLENIGKEYLDAIFYFEKLRGPNY
jgi:hypothetical protein